LGIFEKLEKALAFDSDVVASVIQNIDVLKQLFAAMLKEQAPEYLPFAKGWDDKAKERVARHYVPTQRGILRFPRGELMGSRTVSRGAGVRRGTKRRDGSAKDERVALTLKVDQKLFERLSTFRAKERKKSQEILQQALLEYLDRAGA
jgi:hypothetical protein